MLNGERLDADVICAQYLYQAQVFERASRRQATSDDALNALIFAWGADIASIQSSLFEQIVIARKAPIRQYFQEAETLIAHFDVHELNFDSTASTAQLQMNIREQLFSWLPSDSRAAISSRLPDITYLEAIESPSAEQIHAGAQDRLQGMSASEFAVRRRREANELMLSALSSHARDEGNLAIELAYESDFRSLEAYLVDSALAVGDQRLWTVELRWELSKSAISEVELLPDAFEAAVHAIRSALTTGLGSPDSVRFQATLPDLGITMNSV